jgi:hypothetical protein
MILARRLAAVESALTPTPLIADLVEPAKVTALEQLGEGRRVFGIATAWLRENLGASD